MHQRAAEADLIIVNHHLFFADLALKQDDFGSILPEYSAVIFDEAHEIEDVASDYFGRQISNYRFEELARDTDNPCALTSSARPDDFAARPAHARKDPRPSSTPFPRATGVSPLTRNERAAFLEQHRESYDHLLAALKSSGDRIAAMPPRPEELLGIARRSPDLRRKLAFLFESDEKNYVYWFERRNKGVFVAATPIDVSLFCASASSTRLTP